MLREHLLDPVQLGLALKYRDALPRDGNVCLQHTEEMDGAKFAKLCRDSKLLSRTVTASDADLFFAKV